MCVCLFGVFCCVLLGVLAFCVYKIKLLHPFCCCSSTVCGLQFSVFMCCVLVLSLWFCRGVASSSFSVVDSFFGHFTGDCCGLFLSCVHVVGCAVLCFTFLCFLLVVVVCCFVFVVCVLRVFVLFFAIVIHVGLRVGVFLFVIVSPFSCFLDVVVLIHILCFACICWVSLCFVVFMGLVVFVFPSWFCMFYVLSCVFVVLCCCPCSVLGSCCCLSGVVCMS